MAWHTTWNDPPERRSGWLVDRGGFFPPGVKLVLIVTLGVYFLDVFTAGALTKWGALSVRHLMQLQVWRLFTYMFLHSRVGIDHILWNMFIFVMLGATLERQLGARQFLWLYFGSGVVGGVCEVAFNLAMHFEHGSFMTRVGPIAFLDISSVGASAGVAGVLVAFAVINPRATFLLFFILPIQARWLAIIYVVIETRHIVLGLRTGWGDGVAHAAHFGGMALGFVWMKWGTRIVAALGQRARRTPHAFVERDRADEQAEVDRILDKIRLSGLESLTTREKLFLQEMGNKYRDRS